MNKQLTVGSKLISKVDRASLRVRIGDTVILNPKSSDYHFDSWYAECLGKVGVVFYKDRCGYSVRFECGETILMLNRLDMIKGNKEALLLL